MAEPRGGEPGLLPSWLHVLSLHIYSIALIQLLCNAGVFDGNSPKCLNLCENLAAGGSSLGSSRGKKPQEPRTWAFWVIGPGQLHSRFD
jgi:hypothetical protein